MHAACIESYIDSVARCERSVSLSTLEVLAGTLRVSVSSLHTHRRGFRALRNYSGREGTLFRAGRRRGVFFAFAC